MAWLQRFQSDRSLQQCMVEGESRRQGTWSLRGTRRRKMGSLALPGWSSRSLPGLPRTKTGTPPLRHQAAGARPSCQTGWAAPCGDTVVRAALAVHLDCSRGCWLGMAAGKRCMARPTESNGCEAPAVHKSSYLHVRECADAEMRRAGTQCWRGSHSPDVNVGEGRAHRHHLEVRGQHVGYIWLNQDLVRTRETVQVLAHIGGGIVREACAVRQDHRASADE